MSKYLDFIGRQISQVKSTAPIPPKSGSPNFAVVKEKISEGWPYVLGTLAVTGIVSLALSKTKRSKSESFDKTYPLDVNDGQFFDQDATAPSVMMNTIPEEFESETDVTQVDIRRLNSFEDQDTEIINDFDQTLKMPVSQMEPKELFHQQEEETEIIQRNPVAQDLLGEFDDFSGVANDNFFSAQDTIELPPKRGAANEEEPFPDEMVKQMGVGTFLQNDMQTFLDISGDGEVEEDMFEGLINDSAPVASKNKSEEPVQNQLLSHANAFDNIFAGSNDVSKFVEDQGPVNF